MVDENGEVFLEDVIIQDVASALHEHFENYISQLNGEGEE